MEVAERMKNMVPGIFNEMEQVKKKVEEKGTSVINLGVGSPDLPPAPHIVEAMHRALDEPANYRYPLEGMPRLCKAASDWYYRRFNVEIDPEKEVLVLMGSQDGLGHISLAYINPGDTGLVPDPGYPIYTSSMHLAGGNIHYMPLLAENDFLPDLEAIPEEAARKAKIMFLNYPNNPVAVRADREFFEKVVHFARKYDIIVCHDAAYCELYYEGKKPAGLLEVPGAKDVGVEFYSLSKTYNMAGCRLGFVTGNSTVLETLGRLKSNIDFGVFKPVQEAGVAAMEGPQDCVKENADVYRRRRDILVDGLARSGWNIPKPQASMFLWAPLPGGRTSSRDFAFELLEETGVLVIPGVAFGPKGEGYVRMGMVQDEDKLSLAVERISNKYGG